MALSQSPRLVVNATLPIYSLRKCVMPQTSNAYVMHLCVVHQISSKTYLPASQIQHMSHLFVSHKQHNVSAWTTQAPSRLSYLILPSAPPRLYRASLMLANIFSQRLAFLLAGSYERSHGGYGCTILIPVTSLTYFRISKLSAHFTSHLQ